ncbi:MAG TPA: hypothetical protein VF077_05355 [Nitrospiraceae bacterium]
MDGTTSTSNQSSFGRNISNQASQSLGSSTQSSVGRTRSSSAQQASSMGETSSYIPEYSQTPILEGIAKYAANMAPEVYQWGMTQYNKNQGNIDRMMQDAMSYASPQRVAQEMGQAQAGVMQGAEQGRQNAIRDLEGFGIDPSSGRYAALDTANRVMSSATAAGAGNQQRMATEAAGGAMKQQAQSASLQNQQIGYGASAAANNLLGTGMKLQYSPLGTRSYNASTSSGTTDSASDTMSAGSSNQSSTSYGQSFGTQGSSSSSWGGVKTDPGQGVGFLRMHVAEGGYIPEEVSRSDGEVVDDVPANLTAGEFVIPKDVVEWKGQEYFYKLMAQVRKMRATSGDDSGGGSRLGYGAEDALPQPAG